MSAYIYVEGGLSGPHSKDMTVRCQQAFHKLLDRMGFQGRKPRLVACGGRKEVYERFCVAHATGGKDYIAMWIDSEDPMANIDATWAHLAAVTTVSKWAKPTGAQDDQVLFMTTCMETWIVAGHMTLRSEYGANLNVKLLPPLVQLENRDRHTIQDNLERATKECKHGYAKGKKSYAVLALLDPEVLRRHLPSFVRVQTILDDKL